MSLHVTSLIEDAQGTNTKKDAFTRGVSKPVSTNRIPAAAHTLIRHATQNNIGFAFLAGGFCSAQLKLTDEYGDVDVYWAIANKSQRTEAEDYLKNDLQFGVALKSHNLHKKDDGYCCDAAATNAISENLSNTIAVYKYCNERSSFPAFDVILMDVETIEGEDDTCPHDDLGTDSEPMGYAPKIPQNRMICVSIDRTVNFYYYLNQVLMFTQPSYMPKLAKRMKVEKLQLPKRIIMRKTVATFDIDVCKCVGIYIPQFDTFFILDIRTEGTLPKTTVATTESTKKRVEMYTVRTRNTCPTLFVKSQ